MILERAKNSSMNFLYGLKIENIFYISNEEAISSLSGPHFEILGAQYKNNEPDSEEEIWIPIQLKQNGVF